MTPLSFDYPISVLVLYTDYESDTVKTAMNLHDALRACGHRVLMFKVTAHNWRSALRQSGDVVVNLVEDAGWKLWGKIFTALEDIGRVQFGIDHKSFSYSMSKAKMKKRLVDTGLPTPGFRVLRRGQNSVRGMQFPLILKPSAEHASEGISQDSVVIDEKEFADRLAYLHIHYPGDIVVEEFIEGREFHVTVIGNGRHVAVLPYCEINFGGSYQDNWNVFTYNAKWKATSWEYWDALVDCAIDVPKSVEKTIDALLKRAYRVLGCRDVARFDLRIDEKGKPFIIDMNLLPDLTKSEEVECWMSAQSLGWTYEEFIETLMAICYKRVYGRLPDRMRNRQLLLMSPKA